MHRMFAHLSFSNHETIISREEHDDQLYTRWSLRGQNFPFLAQLLQFKPNHALKMWVGVDQDALELDFEKQSARPDVPDRIYVGRPGVYLSRLARILRDCNGPCIVANGNNIGYWGNQFAIINGRLLFKSVTPLFFDPLEDISGTYPFLVQLTDGTFDSRGIELESQAPNTQEARILLKPRRPDVIDSVVAGISGYPVIMDAKVVWHEHINEAWDPKLLYFIGDVSKLDRSTMLKRLKIAHAKGETLQRHGLTFLALDAGHRLHIMVVEEQESASRGISVLEAARIFVALEMNSCIVLGGKGDAQLVSTQEGALITPLTSSHDVDCSKPIDHLDIHRSKTERKEILLERPVPSFVIVGYCNQGCLPRS